MYFEAGRIRMDNLIRAAKQVSLFSRININMKKELPIRSSEMGMLIYLVKTSGDKTPIGVAKFFHFTKSMATNMVTSLSEKGYIEKIRSNTDKRSILLKPTKKAIELVEATYEEYFKTMAMLKAQMGEEKFKEFLALLEMANGILLEVKDNG